MKKHSRARVNDNVFRLHSKCTYTLLQVGRLIMLTVIKYYLNDANLDEFNAELTSNGRCINALSRKDKLEEHLQDKDVLFLYHVIKRTKFIPSPKNGWGKTVDASSITSSDDVERIRQMRNQIFHDPKSFSESVLKGYWCDLMYLIKRIDQEYDTGFHSFTQSLEDCCSIWKKQNVESSEMKNQDPYLELDKLVKADKISTEESDDFKEIIKVLPRQHKVLYVQPFMSQTKNEKEAKLIERGKTDGRPAKFLYKRCGEDTNHNESAIRADNTIAIEIQGEKTDGISEKEKLQATHRFITLHPDDRITLEVSPNCFITISKEGSLVLIIKCKDVSSKADLERKLENGSLGIVLKSILQNACLKMQIDDIDDIHVTLQEQSKIDDSFEIKDCPHLKFLVKHEDLFLDELCPSTMIECLENEDIDMTAVRRAIDDYPDERLYHVSSLLSTLVKAGEKACAVFKSCLDCTGHTYLDEEWNRLQTEKNKEKHEAFTDSSLIPSSSKPDPYSVEHVIIEDMQEFCDTMKQHDNSSDVDLNNHKAPESSTIGQEKEKAKLTQDSTISNLSNETDSRRDENPYCQFDAMFTAPSGDSQLCFKEYASRSNSPSRETLPALDLGLSDEKGCSKVKVNVDIFRLHSKCTYTLLEVGRSIMLTVIKHHLNDAYFHDFNAALVLHQKDTPVLRRIDKLEEHFQNKDVLFLYHLITHTTFIPYPRNGWGKNVDPFSITSSDDIERIRQMRNKLVHDPTTFRESDLQQYWYDLVYLVKRIDQEYNTSFHKITCSLEDCCDSMQFANIGSTEMKYVDPYLELDKLVKDELISKEVSDTFKEIITRLPRRDKVLYVQPFKSQSKNEKETNLIKKGSRTKSVRLEYTWDEEDKEDRNQDCPHLEFIAKHESLILEELCPSTMIECLEQKDVDMTPVRQAIDEYPDDRLYHVSCLLATLVKKGEEACAVFKSCLDSTGHVYLNDEWNRLETATAKEEYETYTGLSHFPSSSKQQPDSIEDWNHDKMQSKNSPLHRAAGSSLRDLKWQLSHKILGFDKKSPLHKAARFGDTDTLKLLLESGADVNKADKVDRRPLHNAAGYGKTDAVKLLLEYGADVNKTNKIGRSPLHDAAGYGKTDAVRLLLEYGADVNKTEKFDKISPLHGAAAYGHTDTVKLLLEYGADVNQTDEDDISPLHDAAGYGHTDAVKLLLQFGADVNQTDKDGRNPLYRAAGYGKTDAVRLLLEYGVDVNKTDNQFDKSALHEAAAYGHTDVVRLLLESGADVSKIDKCGQSALQKAEERNHDGVVLLLSKPGADAVTKNRGRLEKILEDQGLIPRKTPVKQTKEDWDYMSGYMSKSKDVQTETTEYTMSEYKDPDMNKEPSTYLAGHDVVSGITSVQQTKDVSDVLDYSDFVSGYTMSKYEGVETTNTTEDTLSKCKDSDIRKQSSANLGKKFRRAGKERKVLSFGIFHQSK